MKEKKFGIMTIVSGDKYQKIWERSEPFFNDYADRCGADLLVLKELPDLPSPHWAKFSIYELLRKQYDRIAFIDADIIIRPDAPSLFDIVPEDQFGIFNEGQYTPRSICIYEAKKVHHVELPKWDGKAYYNTGVMVISKEHRHIFKISEPVKPLRNSFGEQTYLNVRIMKSEVKIFPLSHRFNRMSIMDRITGMSRLDSYLVHYAGFDIMFGEGSTLTAMDRDIGKWKQDAPDFKYKQQIFVWSLGGLGDVIAAEPTIRYMRNVIYPDANIAVMSTQHELYRHIEGIDRFDKYSIPKKEMDAVYEINTHPTASDKYNDFQIDFGFQIPHAFVHPVDWVSLNAINRQLPLKDREIHLETTDDLPAETDLILIHPGKGWETKTFPVEWWQKVIDDLDSKGFKVGIIGKDTGIIQGCAHGYVAVKCPPKGTDFRDKLDLQQLINLISKAPLVISNDSSPVHIAGAFDNYIILIPTCKHPDAIMPYRKGQQYYKAAALYKSLSDDIISGRPTDLTGWQLGSLKGRKIEDYLPEPEEIVNKTVEMMSGQSV